MELAVEKGAEKTMTKKITKPMGSLTEIIQQLETGERVEFEIVGNDIPQSYPHFLNLAAKYGASVSFSADYSKAMFSFD